MTGGIRGFFRVRGLEYLCRIDHLQTFNTRVRVGRQRGSMGSDVVCQKMFRNIDTFPPLEFVANHSTTQKMSSLLLPSSSLGRPHPWGLKVLDLMGFRAQGFWM